MFSKIEISHYVKINAMLKKRVILALQQHVNPASHQVTCLASATLAKCGFLCTVLAENPEYHNLAFRVGLFGLEMARPPANTKPLEVRLKGTMKQTLFNVICEIDGYL